MRSGRGEESSKFLCYTQLGRLLHEAFFFIDKKFCRENRAGKETALCIGAPVASDAYRLNKLMLRIAFVQQITDFFGLAGCFTPFPGSYIPPPCQRLLKHKESACSCPDIFRIRFLNITDSAFALEVSGTIFDFLPGDAGFDGSVSQGDENRPVQ